MLTTKFATRRSEDTIDKGTTLIFNEAPGTMEEAATTSTTSACDGEHAWTTHNVYASASGTTHTRTQLQRAPSLQLWNQFLNSRRPSLGWALRALAHRSPPPSFFPPTSSWPFGTSCCSSRTQHFSLVIEANFNVIWICLTQFELMELMCDEFLQILSEKEDFVLPSYKLTKWSRDTDTGTSEMQRRKQLHSTESSDSKGLQWKQGIWWCSACTEHNRIGPSQSTTLLQ
jgi:hypothetical protein